MTVLEEYKLGRLSPAAARLVDEWLVEVAPLVDQMIHARDRFGNAKRW